MSRAARVGAWAPEWGQGHPLGGAGLSCTLTVPPHPRAQLHSNTHMEPPLGRAPVWVGWWRVALCSPAKGCPRGSEASVACLCSGELVLRKGVQATGVRDPTRSPVPWEALSCAEAGRSRELMPPSRRNGVRPGVPHRLRRRSPRQEAWWPRPEWDSSKRDTLWRQSPWGYKDRAKAVSWASGLSSGGAMGSLS